MVVNDKSEVDIEAIVNALDPGAKVHMTTLVQRPTLRHAGQGDSPLPTDPTEEARMHAWPSAPCSVVPSRGRPDS